MLNTTGENEDELINNIFQWTPSHGQTIVGRPAKAYIHKVCLDTVFGLEDQPRAMDDRDGWRERESQGTVCYHPNFMISKLSDLSRGWPEGSLFNSYYNKVLGRALLLSLDYFTLPLILTL